MGKFGLENVSRRFTYVLDGNIGASRSLKRFVAEDEFQIKTLYAIAYFYI